MIVRAAALLLSAPIAAAWATRSPPDGPLGPARWSLSHDPLGAPNWRLVSSRGRHVVKLPPFINKVSVGPPCGCAGS